MDEILKFRLYDIFAWATVKKINPCEFGIYIKPHMFKDDEVEVGGFSLSVLLRKNWKHLLRNHSHNLRQACLRKYGLWRF